jgi:serine/threonine protein kinase
LLKPIKRALASAPLSETVSAIAHIGDTLDRLVKRGIHHRDIKPSNLYKFEGHFVVGDFGIVKRLDLEQEPVTPTRDLCRPGIFPSIRGVFISRRLQP